MQMQLTQGRPDSPEGRLSKELAVYDLLDRLGIDYQRVDHDAAFTMEVMCKNLLLCNTQKTRFYLLMLGCDKKFRTGEISRQIGSARLSFAPPEPMEEYLDITPGSLSVMGLMNDHENHVRLLIDEDILASALVGCHPCVNTASLRLSVRDLLEKFLPAVGHDYTPVHAS